MDGQDERDFLMRGIPGFRPRIEYGVTFFRGNNGYWWSQSNNRHALEAAG